MIVSARELAALDLDGVAERLRDVAEVRGLDTRAGPTRDALTAEDQVEILELAERVGELSRRLRGWRRR